MAWVQADGEAVGVAGGMKKCPAYGVVDERPGRLFGFERHRESLNSGIHIEEDHEVAAGFPVTRGQREARVPIEKEAIQITKPS